MSFISKETVVRILVQQLINRSILSLNELIGSSTGVCFSLREIEVRT